VDICNLIETLFKRTKHKNLSIFSPTIINRKLYKMIIESIKLNKNKGEAIVKEYLISRK
jgi:hypothetical protein